MGRTEYQDLLDEAEALERTKGCTVWDLEAEAKRLNLKLEELPVDEKGWDRAVNVAYRKAALRAHPDKHPPHQRAAAEANFKLLNESNKLMLRVGKAIREEAESGNAEIAIAEQKKLDAEATAAEEARLASQLRQIMSVNGVSAGFAVGNGHVPEMDARQRTKRDFEKQLIALLARTGEEFKARARRRRRWRIIRRVLAGVAVGAFLWLVRKTAPNDEDASEELREMVEQVRYTIRQMGRELAAAIGNPAGANEMADELEVAFLEGRMNVNDEGGLEILLPDDEEEGMYYKLNMSSGPDGTMQIWTELANGEKMAMETGDFNWENDEPTVGLYGLTNEGTAGNVNIFEGEVNDGGEEKRKRGKKKGEKKKGDGWFGGFGGERRS